MIICNTIDYKMNIIYIFTIYIEYISNDIYSIVKSPTQPLFAYVNSSINRNRIESIDFKTLAFVREKIVMKAIDRYINTIDLTIANENTSVPTFKTPQFIKIHGEEFKILPIDREYNPNEEYNTEKYDFVEQLINKEQISN